ncbi:4'-phosphopantetheinyl transferase superfamily protein [Pseudomonas sp. CAU 1711]|uniref:4'-phosphopantetheinyl transferase family protein n=1 Tax=Pseudomonas sp. CAU 1711 TaxID=3140356 RepID=UPI003261C10C
MNHPAFFQLQADLPHWLPDSQLVLARFDPRLLRAEDFAACAVPMVRGVAKRQAEHLAGRLCAREALRRLCGQALLPGRDAEGVPLWPAGICGSISHGAGRAAALVAYSRDWASLGIDLEQRLSEERAARLACEILTPAELQRAARLSPQALAERVSLTFSLKESLFKALYPLVRQRFYFQDAELLECDAAQARLRLLIDLHLDWPAGRELDGHFRMQDDLLLSLVPISPARR